MFLITSGPGKLAPVAHKAPGVGRTHRAAPNAPPGHYQQPKAGNYRARSASSLKRYQTTQKQPSKLPSAGAHNKARGPAKTDIAHAAFMQTPESGVCG